MAISCQKSEYIYAKFARIHSKSIFNQNSAEQNVHPATSAIWYQTTGNMTMLKLSNFFLVNNIQITFAV